MLSACCRQLSRQLNDSTVEAVTHVRKRIRKSQVGLIRKKKKDTLQTCQSDLSLHSFISGCGVRLETTSSFGK